MSYFFYVLFSRDHNTNFADVVIVYTCMHAPQTTSLSPPLCSMVTLPFVTPTMEALCHDVNRHSSIIVDLMPSTSRIASCLQSPFSLDDIAMVAVVHWLLCRTHGQPRLGRVPACAGCAGRRDSLPLQFSCTSVPSSLAKSAAFALM